MPAASSNNNNSSDDDGIVVLSRIAESLYWIGRYWERAEDTARILDVHTHVVLEDRGVDEAAAGRVLLDVMGVDDKKYDIEPDVESVSALLARDRSYPGSIVRSLNSAWENARGAREVISSEMWETLNATHHALTTRVRRATGPGRHEFFDWVKGRAATFAGQVDSTLSRDDGWWFLVLGRSLERADMTARLLSSRYGETWDPAGWTTTLRSCSAYEAYLRTYRRSVDAFSAAEFLLLDRLFPRSVFQALTTAEHCLAELDPLASRTGIRDDARRLLGRVVAELAFFRTDDLLFDLSDTLTRLEQDCAQVHSAVAARYFRETRAIEWSV
jgi:uncharacterized alpha-E superfamily protein